VNLQKVEYGKLETKRAIANVLSNVLRTYKYTSLPELNAVLKQYNIMADGGSEDSRIYKNMGLVYYAPDDSGKRVGGLC
jgi:phage pi2 protein 07